MVYSLLSVMQTLHGVIRTVSKASRSGIYMPNLTEDVPRQALKTNPKQPAPNPENPNFRPS